MTISWWTLGIQFVNVVILIWLLGRFFWRPVAAMIEQRRVTSQRTITDAGAKHEEAIAALAEIARTRAGFGHERDKILADAQAAAERMRTEATEDGKKAAASLIAGANTEIEKNKIEVEKAWTERASQLAVEIAARLAQRLDGPAIHAVFLSWLLDEIGKLPLQTRQAAVANEGPIKAISATFLDAAEQQRCSDAIAKAFGTDPKIVFQVSPALIAGLELHGPHFIIGNSWRADLTQIHTALAI